MLFFHLPSSECLKEVWKGDTGTKGGDKEESARNDGAEQEGANDSEKKEEEPTTHDAGELWK